MEERLWSGHHLHRPGDRERQVTDPPRALTTSHGLQGQLIRGEYVRETQEDEAAESEDDDDDTDETGNMA